jgi:GT2 family glycosyltransferase
MELLLDKLRMKFLPLGSKAELRLRTIVHQITATKLYILWQQWKVRQSYFKWRDKQKKQSLPDPKNFPFKPKVSFLLSVSTKNLNDALFTIKSIQSLRISNWEIILIPAGMNSANLELTALLEGDPRVKCASLDQSNQIVRYKNISGEFIVHCAAGDFYFNILLNLFYQSLNSSPSADVYYYDCEYRQDHSSGILPFFKPAAYSPELLLSVNYLSRGFIRKDRIEKLSEKVDNSLEILNQELDLLFLLSENKAEFHHIPQILITQSHLSDQTDKQAEKVISSHLSRVGLQEVRCQKTPVGRRFQWKINDPSVSIIIPSKNNSGLLKNLIDSIIRVSEYPNYSITVVDNASDDPETLTYYTKLKKEPKVSVLHYDKPFNYSEAMNLGANNSHSDLLLLINNDMKVIDPNWLTELAQWALRPDVGVVGTKLIRANHTIQHAGVILGMNGFMGHLYLNAPEHYVGLLGSVDWYRNFYAVTGACQMVRRDLFNRVCGYDEHYKLIFGDIDFCLRIQKIGFRVMYTPFTSLIHYEGSSRGYKSPIDDILRGYDQMIRWLESDDPYFSPNLTYSTIPMCQLHTNSIDQRLKKIEERKNLLLKMH